MRNKHVALTAVWLGALSVVILLWAGTTGAGPPMQEPEDKVAEVLASMDDGFWYQGRLTDGAGNPLPNADVVVGFRIYNSTLATATALDVTTITVNTDGNGLFNEEIDFNNAALFNGQALYLGLHVAGEANEMTPRQYLRPVPYALSIRPGAVVRGSITLGDLGEYGYLNVHDTDDVRVLRFSGSSALLTLGGAGEDGDLRITDAGPNTTVDLDGATGYLTLGATGQDGDLVVTNNGPTRTFQVDGETGNVYVYDGVDIGVAHRLFEFDSAFVSAEGYSTGAIWGDQSDNLGNLSLMSNDDVDVYLEQTDPGASWAQFRIYDNAGVLVFRVDEDGNVWAAGNADLDQGTKSAIVQTQEYGRRKLYCMESPGVWFEDFGTAQLANGQATVTIEPLFLQTINTGIPYHVFVTPLGDCNGLYVTHKTSTSFEVRELGGGSANIGFDYRIVAKRLGFEDLRLEPPDPPGEEVPGPGGGRPNASVPEEESEPSEGQE
jgi:hypothetical protein